MKKSIPSTFKPELAILLDKTPSGKEWIHEIKFDGYRILALIKSRSIDLVTRQGKSWRSKLPSLIKQLQTFPQKNTILDGEIVTLNKKGLSQFELLQNALQTGQERDIIYYVFDIPYLNGENLCNFPLLVRKQKIKALFKLWNKTFHPNVLVSKYVKGIGSKVFKKACQKGLEGIISKKADSQYAERRTHAWVKSICSQHQEFVIGGFTKPNRTRKYFGALLLGYYDKNKHLIYCGKVGTGFSEDLLRDLYGTLKPLMTKYSPFEKNAETPNLDQITWVRPQLVAELSFREWTKASRLRHPSFLGLRLDKNPTEVTREG